EWETHIAEISYSDSLNKIKANGQLRKTLNSFYCGHAQYYRLKEALRKYRSIKASGGWPVLPEDILLKKGDTGKLVRILYKRLLATGDMRPEIINIGNSVFDERIEA